MDQHFRKSPVFPAFLLGILRTLDIFGVTRFQPKENRAPYKVLGSERDRNAFRSDWNHIGGDFQNSVATFRKSHKL